MRYKFILLGSKITIYHAKKALEEINKMMIESDVVIFDFLGVDFVFLNFMDDVLGGLINMYGINVVKSKTRFYNSNPAINKAIKETLNKYQ